MSYKRTVLVTGGTSGLGYFAALNIAKELPDHLVVIASRSNGDDAAGRINKALKQNNVVFQKLDLSSIAAVRSFAADWEKAAHPPIQYLLLNAGLQFPGEMGKTGDGMERTFQINHVGHTLLFHLLFHHLDPRCRIVITASGTHDPAQKSGLPDAKYDSAEELAHPTPESAKYEGRQRYATSKLCNVMWTYALHRRLLKLPGKHMTVAAFDPGLMPGTGLARDANGVLKFLWTRVLPKLIPLLKVLVHHNINLPEDSGSNLAYLAMDEKVKGESGVYYEIRKTINSSVDSYDEAKQEDLWSWGLKNVVNIEELNQPEMA